MNRWILIVEDDAGMAWLMGDTLERAGWVVRLAVDGRQVLEQAWEIPPTLMILDHALGDMTVADFINGIRRARGSVPPFMVATSRGDERVAVEMMKLGAQEYLVKDRWFIGNLVVNVTRVINELESAEKLRQTEAALRESEERYRSLVENSRDVILLFDRERRLVFANKAVTEAWGMVPADLVGRTPIETGLDRERTKVIEGAVDQVFQGGEAVFCEIGFPSSQGEITMEFSLYPQRSQGVVVQVLAMAHDVTHRKRLMEDLKEAREAALAASDAKSRFLATMSHEIRTPLNGVIGFLELLLDSPLDATQQDWAVHAQNSGRILLGLLNDILDFSKIEAGKLLLDLMPTSILELADQALSVVGIQARDRGLTLELHGDEDLPLVELDGRRLGQVLINLLGNAVKFTHQGRVDLRISHEIRGTHARIGFSVEDSGIGIPEDRRKDLFRPFTQLDGSITRKYGGTGLGLAISHSLVSLMGGNLVCEPREGGGTVFRFTLEVPVCGLRKVRSTPVASPVDQRTFTAGIRILVAEDVPLNYQLLRTILEIHLPSVVVRGVDNGERAVDAWRKEAWDLVIMDLQMPVLDGLTATRRIRELEARTGRPRVPVLAYSANVEAAIREACEAAGMDDFLPKPVDQETVKALLHRILDRPGPGGRDTTSPTPSPVGGPVGSPPASPPMESIPVFDAPHLLELLGGNRRLLAAMILEAQRVFPALIADLAEHCHQQERTSIYSLAHKLKGSAGSMALGRLQNLALQLERSMSGEEPTQCSDLVGRIADHWIEVQRLLVTLDPDRVGTDQP